jgi:hypothetical protein
VRVSEISFGSPDVCKDPLSEAPENNYFSRKVVGPRGCISNRRLGTRGQIHDAFCKKLVDRSDIHVDCFRFRERGEFSPGCQFVNQGHTNCPLRGRFGISCPHTSIMPSSRLRLFPFIFHFSFSRHHVKSVPVSVRNSDSFGAARTKRLER